MSINNAQPITIHREIYCLFSIQIPNDPYAFCWSHAPGLSINDAHGVPGSRHTVTDTRILTKKIVGPGLQTDRLASHLVPYSSGSWGPRSISRSRKPGKMRPNLEIVENLEKGSFGTNPEQMWVGVDWKKIHEVGTCWPATFEIFGMCGWHLPVCACTG